MKFSSLIFANLLRKKARLILTVGSFAIALFLFAFLAVVRAAFNQQADVASADRLISRNRISLSESLPLSYYEQIARIPGLAAVTHFNWFGGIYQDEKNFFPQFVIDPEHQRQVMPELVVQDDQWQNFVHDRQGTIVGAKTAKRFGWKIGDRIPIQNSRYGPLSTWDFNIDGIYHSQNPGGDETQFWLQWDYFEEKVPQDFKGKVGWYTVKLDKPDSALSVSNAIDSLFDNSAYETKTETESAFAASFVKQFGNIEGLIMIIGSVVFFTLLLVTGNTMAIAVRERTGELAVLKAIGFSDRAVLFFVLAESILIAVIGGVLGLGLSALAIPGLGSALAGMLPPLNLSATILSMGLLAALLVGAVAGIIPGIGAMRMRVVTALRRI
ncbi:MAG: FtsX-like permease family protein [Candidatus Sulfotelmatobacter sp.]|jgi:putative ABC transport system permease protein